MEATAPLDVTFPLPNGDVIDLYGVVLTPENPGSYTASVYAVCYNKNPFRTPYYGLDTLEGLGASGTPYHISPGGGMGSPNTVYESLDFSPLSPGDTLLVQCRVPGYTFQQEVPLPWQEVSP